MKLALLFHDGDAQLVATPETDEEKRMVACFWGKEVEAVVSEGSFYNCTGGWMREGSEPRSLIVRLSKPLGVQP